MPGCNCAGSACGCQIQPGLGVNVTGTGTASNPFVISAAINVATIEQNASGPLDLSTYVGDMSVTVNLSANVTSMILPNAPGTRLDLFFVTVVTGVSVVWPTAIRWAGTATTPSATVGEAAWATLRQTADFWAGNDIGVL